MRQATPGVVIAAVMWVITFLRWDASAYVTSEMNFLWQSAGIDNLRNDPWGTLQVLHIQPPGMNAIFALDLAITPSSHLVLLGINAAAMFATIIVIVDTVRRFGASPRYASGAGIAYALLPATIIYSQWAYSVAVIALLSVVAVWGISVMSQHPNLGVITSAAAIGFAALIRPSYTVPLVIAWALGLALVLLRGRGKIWAGKLWPGFAGIVAVLALVLVVQLHYVASFGLSTMSSWTGENLAKALSTSQSLSVTDKSRQDIGRSPCQAQMLQALEEDRLNRWDWRAFRGLPACAELPALPERGVAAWDSPLKGASEQENFVYSERLVASREWTSMMTTIVRDDPWQLLRMATTTEFGPRNSGLGLYLGPSEDYPFVSDIRDAHPLAVPLGLWSLVFGPLAWVLAVGGVVVAVAYRRSIVRRSPIFWGAIALATYHLAVNVLFEYSENMRYRAEIDGVLMIIVAIVLSATFRVKTS